jgi:uncharacterized membrane-anchored protein YitT (DUF2179 family)
MRNIMRISKEILCICLGAFLCAVAVNAFIVPHNLLSGGLTGISLMLNYAFKLPISILVLALNIPLFVAAFFKVGRRFMLLSLLGMLLLSLCLELTKGIYLGVENILVAAVAGGALGGFGGGIVLRQRACLGGTDMISVMINKFFSFPIGSISAVINSIVLIALGILSGIEVAIISVISIYVSGQVTDAIQSGFNRSKAVFILSDKWMAVKNALTDKTRRGITLIPVHGGYTYDKKEMLYCMIKSIEIPKLKDAVYEIDENAFITILDARDIYGKGFLSSRKEF